MALPFPQWMGRNGKGRPADFHALFDQLHEARLNLEQASDGLETKFLATCSELEGLSRFSGDFVKQVERLVNLATGQQCDRTVFSNAIGLIEEATRFLTGCQEQTGQMLEQLRNYNSQIEHLLGVEIELERTMLPLKFVQTLFKAESAPMGAAVQQMFAALTQEIEGLHSQVREIFGTKFKQLEQTHRSIGQVIVQLDRQARSLEQVMTIHRAKIESSLETLKKEMSSNQERDVRLGRLSKDLSQEVNQVVMGLQFQDIIHQKLEHVTKALPLIEAKFAEFQAAPKSDAARESLQFVRQSCRVEAGQVEAAREELANAETTMQGSVQKVLSHLTEMDSKCLSLDEFKLLTTSFDGMVQVLLEMIEEVRGLVAATVASATEAYEMLRPLGGLASDLTAIVRAMSSRIHLISLNAQVQAAQAAIDPRGAGLEVLAARTNEISKETNHISKEAALQLDNLGAGLADSVKAFGKLRDDGLAQQNQLNQQGRTEEEHLHAFRDSALDALRAIGDALDDIQRQARQTLETIRFEKFHKVRLPGLRTPLVAIADMADQWLQRSGASQDILVEGLKRDYTMESERVVFDKVVSAGISSSAPVPVSEPVASPDIEFFDVSSSASDGETPLPETQKLETAPAIAEPTVPPVADGSDLGANVELF
jgi:hypothetical protein